jgi:hypothetical protein
MQQSLKSEPQTEAATKQQTLTNGYHKHGVSGGGYSESNGGGGGSNDLNNNTTGDESQPVAATGAAVVAGTTTLVDDNELKRLLSNQLEFYFSRENLLHDKYLVSQMDNDQYVPIAILASFNMIKKLFASSKTFQYGETTRLEERIRFLIEAVKSNEATQLQLDASNSKLRANHKRCVVILREIDKQTPTDEILALFDQCTVKCLHCEFAGNRSWYLSFKDELDAQIAVHYLKEEIQTFKSESLFARIKTHPIPRANLNNTSNSSSSKKSSIVSSLTNDNENDINNNQQASVVAAAAATADATEMLTTTTTTASNTSSNSSCNDVLLFSPNSTLTSGSGDQATNLNSHQLAAAAYTYPNNSNNKQQSHNLAYTNASAIPSTSSVAYPYNPSSFYGYINPRKHLAILFYLTMLTYFTYECNS